MALKTIKLTDWEFALGNSAGCLKDARKVRVPHTWNIEDGLEDVRGTGWYRTVIRPEESLRGMNVRILFHGAYHDARVFLNGKEIAEHLSSGYTPFEVNIGELVPGEEYELMVSVDNSFSQNALPYMNSYDWAGDGGLTRPVELLLDGGARMTDLRTVCEPVIPPDGTRHDRGMVFFGFSCKVEGAADEVRWSLMEGAKGAVNALKDAPVLEGVISAEEAKLLPVSLPEMVYWHFDCPNLYTLRLELTRGDEVVDRMETAVGFRSLKLQGDRWFMNGEAVRLPGMEWMPGSMPEYGDAEPMAAKEVMLRLLKEANTVITRFHWQQDDDLYDWCDRHGLMVQEEVPFWGKDPEKAGKAQLEIAKKQLREMIGAHRNHPSILAWGVGNELNAQDDDTNQYIRDAVAYARKLDPSRHINYVTNTIFDGQAKDGTGEGDVLMVNDYIGTWFQDYDQNEEWDKIRAARPARALIPSEYGLCEPRNPGGDPRRNKIFLEKTACYRPREEIAGTVYFCLNDYRTQCGEEGAGRERRRVHGSVDMRGAKKPSYETVRREHSPLIAEKTAEGVRLTCRNDLPRYEVRGYYVEAGNEKTEIPSLRPGERFEWAGEIPAEGLRIARMNGDLVLIVKPE